MTYDAVMFDLDGTLADTLFDIAAAANHALAAVGLPTVSAEQCRARVGWGAAKLIHDLLGAEHATRQIQVHDAFMDYYAAHDHDHTTLYPGVAALLDTLTRRGVTLAVMSNKPDALTQSVVRELLGRWPFAAVRGQVDGVTPKPDPAGPLLICDALQIPPTRWVYVGDSGVDMQTGKAAGFFTVGVSWGFRSVAELRETGADTIIKSPGELLNHMGDDAV